MEIERHEQVAIYADAFLTALESYTDELRHKGTLARLGLKGTLWGAGFPVGNIEVEFLSADSEGRVSLLDFLGPNVDQGFRLCTLADLRKVPISVDIAHMLAHGPEHPGLVVGFEEPRGHKGVPMPYPFIWLDRQRGQQSAEDHLLGRRPGVAPAELRPWLEDLYTLQVPNIARPFLETDPDPQFSRIPADMDARRNNLMNRSAEEGYVEGRDVAATGSSPTDPPLPDPPGPRTGEDTNPTI
ncbi:MAG: hypothetical protein ACK5ZV_04580 [bacterium]